jgi:hypothetical protein
MWTTPSPSGESRMLELIRIKEIQRQGKQTKRRIPHDREINPETIARTYPIHRTYEPRNRIYPIYLYVKGGW